MRRIRRHARDYVRQRAPQYRPNLEVRSKVDDHASPDQMMSLRNSKRNFVREHARRGRRPNTHQKTRVDSHAAKESMAKLTPEHHDFIAQRRSKRSPNLQQAARVDDHADEDMIAALVPPEHDIVREHSIARTSGQKGNRRSPGTDMPNTTYRSRRAHRRK